MNHLKIRTLESGWCDRDELLLHADFQILVDFVEQERPAAAVDWNHDTIHRRAWKEIASLYRWWKKERPARKSPLNNKKLKSPPFRFKKIPGTNLSELIQPNRKKYALYYRALRRDSELQKKWLEEDQRNLHRLIEIRSFLWT